MGNALIEFVSMPHTQHQVDESALTLGPDNMHPDTESPSFNPSYIKARSNIVKRVPSGSRRVLDVGCATGATGERLKELTPGLQVVGVELDPEMAKVARTRLDEVLVGDVGEILESGALEGQRFDCIILADLLEHVVDPWELLRTLVRHLEPGGTIMSSLPNVRHVSTIFSLLFAKRWPYRDRGIHDRTHLRFFAQRNLKDLFEGAGLSMKIAKRTLRLIETPHRLNRYSWILGFPPFRDLVTFQYLILARPLDR